MARGKWRDSAHVAIHQASARLKIKYRAVMDGVLVKLERETVLEIHLGSLRVLVPFRVTRAEAA
jgi:hypothetical protein